MGLTARVTARGPSAEQLAGADAADHLAVLRASAPVAWVDDVDGWLVTGHAAAVEVMRDAGTFTVDDPRFSTARVVGPSMLSTDGAEHRRHRRPFAAAYRPSRVEQTYGEAARGLAEELLDRVRPLGSADLRPTLAGPLSVRVMARVLDLVDVDADTLLGWYAALVDAVSALSAGREPAPAADAAMADLAAQLQRSTGRDSVLRGAGATLSPAEVVSDAAVMLFGGIETSEGMILSAVAHLLAEPGVLDLVRDDAGAAAAVVEESLRLEPAAAVVDRYAVHDVVLHGAAVARGDLVRVSLAGANRDPAVFTDPDRFDPRRPRLRDQLAFARGPHTCLAMDLARLEARVAVQAVAALAGVRLVRAEPPTGLVFRKPAAVEVAWEAATSGRAR